MLNLHYLCSIKTKNCNNMTNKTNMNHSIKSVQSKLVAILICGIMVLASCSNNDNSTPPDTTALTMWQAGRTTSILRL